MLCALRVKPSSFRIWSCRHKPSKYYARQLTERYGLLWDQGMNNQSPRF